MKRAILIAIATAALVLVVWGLDSFIGISYAQTVGPISPFYFKTATSSYPINASTTLTLPVLGVGTYCVHSVNGLLQVTNQDCGGGNGNATATGTVPYVAYFNSATGLQTTTLYFNSATGQFSLNSSSQSADLDIQHMGGGTATINLGVGIIANNPTTDPGGYTHDVITGTSSINMAGEHLLTSQGYNTFVGVGAGGGTTPYDNTGVNAAGNYNTCFGFGACGQGISNNSTTGGFSITALGYLAGLYEATGNLNVHIGNSAGLSNRNGIDDTFLGSDAGFSYGTSTLADNRSTFVGNQSAQNCLSGSDVTIIGQLAGNNQTTCANDIIIGEGVDLPRVDQTSSIDIGNIIYALNLVQNFGTDTSSTVVNGKVGIGTSAPTGTLEIDDTHAASAGGIDLIAQDTSSSMATPFIFSHKSSATNFGSLDLLGLNVYNNTGGSTVVFNTSTGGYSFNMDSRNIAAPTLQLVSYSTSSATQIVLTAQQNGDVTFGGSVDRAHVNVGVPPTAGATKSNFLIDSNLLAGGNASGTELGINATGSYNGDFADFQVSGTKEFTVASSGVTTFGAATAPAVTSASGSIAYSTNNNMLIYGDGNVSGTIPRVLYSKALAGWLQGSTLASDTLNSAQASNTEANFATTYTFPANYFLSGKMVKVDVGFQSMDATANLASGTLYVELRKAGSATTTLFSWNPGRVISDYTANVGVGYGTTFTIAALNGPASNASVTLACVSCAGGDSGSTGFLYNIISQPTSTDTTAAEILQIGLKYRSNTIAATTSLIDFNVEEMN